MFFLTKMSGNKLIFQLLILFVSPAVLFAITTIHHDKPESARISKMVRQMRESHPRNITNPIIERQKRLLPYYQRLTNIINYRTKPRYIDINPKYTPFLDSNALPGPFLPIVKNNQPNEFLYGKPPDYPAIYEKLVALKQENDQLRKPVQFNYAPIRLQNAPETVIETYQPTNIEIQEEDKPTQYITANLAQSQQQTPRPLIIYRTTPRPETDNTKNVNTIIDDKYEAQKLVYEQAEPEIQPVYVQPPKYYTAPETPATENPNTLSVILKKLQDSNALPTTLTPENIDNSIKTLVKILSGLKKQPSFVSNPIVVDEEIQEHEPVVEKPAFVPGTITQSFPANTIDGGTPGRPGVDYPALSSIPQTSFTCKSQRYKGFFGDPHTNCQVWHYCDLNGGQASFLCPNGTIFSQVALTCDWWYNVKCASTAQLYVLNERLYKYILPFSPKFPEDYSGPLVDKYLTLKFREMEEKMNKEKSNEEASEEEEDKDDSDQLQDINNRKNDEEK